MKYQPHVDGLRAVAILLVLIYHGGLALFPAGFIGVDVFFVISGFLITRLIYDGLETQQFSFQQFYLRRLWRLQPVYLTLLLVTTLMAFYAYLPDDLLQYMKSVRKAVLFISNQYFMQSTTGYFSPDSHQLLLLHTWSLSIEWQCYLLLPFLLYGLHKWVRPSLISKSLYALFIIFLILSLYLSWIAPGLVYFQFSARIAEFLMGACVAMGAFRQLFLSPLIGGGLGWLSALLIFIVARQPQILLGYPNYYAFLVCGAVGVLISLGEYQPKSFLIKLLSWRPIVFIGLLSYSLYIWHWFVLAMLRYQTISETGLHLCVAYVFIFILAYLSWRYIEKPTRQFKHLKFQHSIMALWIAPILLVHFNSYWVKSQDGLPQRFNKELVNVYAQLNQYSQTERSKCIDHELIPGHCQLGSKQPSAKRALLIGDSFSNHYWGFMDTLGKAANVSILAQGTSSCLTLPGIYLYGWRHFKDRVYEDCYRHTQQYYQWIKQNHYAYVIIGHIWPNYTEAQIIHHLDDEKSPQLTRKRIEYALNRALKVIIQSGAQPILIKSMAYIDRDYHACFFKHIKERKAYDPADCQFNLVVTEKDRWFNRLFDKMSRQYPQLIVLDPKTVQCPAGRCTGDLAGVPVYRDLGHLTDYASYRFGEAYLRQYPNPLS